MKVQKVQLGLEAAQIETRLIAQTKSLPLSLHIPDQGWHIVAQCRRPGLDSYCEGMLD